MNAPGQKGRNQMKTIHQVWHNNVKKEMTYDDICRTLGISPEVRFVKVTPAGTIGFTIGKPEEIALLQRMVRENGFRPTKALATMRV